MIGSNRKIEGQPVGGERGDASPQAGTNAARILVAALVALGLSCAAPAALASTELVAPAVATVAAEPSEQASAWIAPAVAGPRAARLETLSNRTIALAVQVDRDSASVVAFTLKDRPFARLPELAAPRPVADEGPVQIEVALLGPNGSSIVQRVEVNGLCLRHSPDTPAHVEGDTIRLHRETVIVEVPEREGFDAIAVGYYGMTAGKAARTGLGTIALAADRFTAAGGRARYRDLAFASASVEREGEAVPFGSGTVHWPEEYSDPDIYKVYGNEAEGDRRINIVIVPDGYTYAQKSLMESHAQAMVNFFRSRTPFSQHDPFVNYTLIYAYSTESGTDECDCSVVKATAMDTRFPLQTPTCGHSDNRCLYYGTGNGGPNCDPNVSAYNIYLSELRAPVLDTTLVMVNTTRYGGCGGSRAVYSAGNSAAVDIALHELGHSLAGLADEYAYTAGCGTSAGEVNTSLNATSGAWPEWIPDLGAPQVGAQYYQSCVYRPLADCEMRALGVPLCPVCVQRWALTYFSWFRVAPTAPIESSTPSGTLSLLVGDPTDFSVTTRLGTGTTNTFIWRLQSPGAPSPVVVASGSTNHTRTFATPGDYTLSCEVTADTNFVKKQKHGPNRDTATWSIHVTAIPEISADSIHTMTMDRNGDDVTLRFEDIGAAAYNVYVSKTPDTAPFAVSNPSVGKRTCAVPGVTSLGNGMNEVTAYNLEAGLSGSTDVLYVLVSADNGPNTEGSLGQTSASVQRSAQSYCNRAP